MLIYEENSKGDERNSRLHALTQVDTDSSVSFKFAQFTEPTSDFEASDGDGRTTLQFVLQ